MRNALIAIIAAGSVGLASPVFATSFHFPSGSLSGSGYGNSMELTEDGITVVATAWGLTDDSGSPLAWEEGRLGVWSTGLGDCNQDEGLRCSSPLHTVDNAGQLDGILFEFSETVLLGGVMITAWADDFDATFWSGLGAFSPSGMTLADLGAGSESTYDGPDATTGQTRTVDVSAAGAADWLFFSASSVNVDRDKDRMKIKLLTTEEYRVPEPNGLLLIALGLGALVSRRRRG